MKTAMQELIESLEEIKKELNTKWDGDPLARRGIVIAINEATNLLDKEKEQIIDAANQKIFGDITFIGSDEVITKGENYYNQTYNQNK